MASIDKVYRWNRERSVGVLIDPKNRGADFIPRGRASSIFQEMIQAARAVDIDLFYFYPAGVREASGDIAGLWWRRGRWRRHTFPLPPIIYNRLVYRRYEARADIWPLVQRLNASPHTFFFNSHFLNKCEVEPLLDKAPHLAEFRLEHAPFDARHLERMLKQHRTVFIKLCSGNTARGLCKIIRTPAGGYRYAFFRPGRPLRWRRSATVPVLFRYLQRAYGGAPVFMQEGLDLARWQGRIFDLRVLVQKNGRGQWQPAVHTARLAGDAKAFVTHIPNGGRAADLEQLLTALSGREVYEQTAPRLDRLMVEAATALELHSAMKLGVLSMDVGMDRAGRLKLFEINSKPAGFDEPTLRQRHYELLMQYCNFLLYTAPLRHER